MACWPGAMHDSRIFSNSTIKTKFDDRDIDGLLLGDSGYPTLSYLLTPIQNPTTAMQRTFNRQQIRSKGHLDV